MMVIENTTKFEIDGRSAVAIGKFDGIHLGHQKLLHKIIEQKRNGCLACVFTFDTSAAAFFGNEAGELTTRTQKRAVFEKAGVDVLIEFPLNEETAAIEPEDFVTRYLTEQMHAAYICAGADLSFGKKGAGNYDLLQKYASRCGYRIEIIEKVKVDGIEVSSTRLREMIRNGAMEKAAAMLGAPYRIDGLVEHGMKFGRTIGMPTANLIPPADKLLPPNGVYFSRVSYAGKRYKSISNIGYKPTVSDLKVMGVETYLYDFTEEIYGKEIGVELLSFRRPEMKFDSTDVLKRQLQADIAAGRVFFG